MTVHEKKWTPPKLELVRWTVFDSMFDDQINHVKDDDEECIAFVNADNPSTQFMLSAPELYEALESILAIVDESRGVDGWHLNGDTAEWGEFEDIDSARAALASAQGEG